MNVLVIGPHPDDQELGMGGTIAKLAGAGHRVLLLDMTNGEPTPLGSVPQREKEWTAAADILGVQRRLLGLPNRCVEATLAARHAVAGVMREFQAEVVFCPYFEDAHPDHRAVTRIVEDARFDAKLSKTDLPGEPIYPRRLIYYFCTHLKIVPQPSFILDITGHLDTKLNAIRAYETQFVLPEKNAKVVEWVGDLARYMGSRIGTEAGEPFFVREPLGLTGLDGVL